MRILHTENSLNWGGQEYRILEQCAWLNANGHTAFLAAPKKSSIYQRAASFNTPAIPIDFTSTLDLQSIFKLRQFVKNQQIQVIDAHGNKDADIAGFCQDRCTVFRSIHVFCNHNKPRFLRQIRWRYLNHRVIATAAIIATQLDEIGYKPKAKVHIVGEWATDSFFEAAYHKDENRKNLCEELSLNPTHPLFVNIGMLRRDKGQNTYLEVAKIYKETGRKGIFLVVGEPTATQHAYAKALKSYIVDNGLEKVVRFLGYRSDIPKIMSAANGVLLCSNTVEAQSRIVPQAFAVKTPIIASRVGGVPELVSHGKTGYLVEIGHTQSYLDYIQKILTVPEITHTILQSAHEFATSQLTLNAKMLQTLEIYQRALYETKRVR